MSYLKTQSDDIRQRVQKDVPNRATELNIKILMESGPVCLFDTIPMILMIRVDNNNVDAGIGFKRLINQILRKL